MPEAFFLDAADGSQRFCLLHRAAGERRASLLYIHPFAEEMNKSRRMAAIAARTFAAAGFEVLQIDLQGCGDSSGDFGDASWQGWIDDIGLARRWLEAQSAAPHYLWGLRVGCLLAAEVAQMQPQGLAGQLWWQPPASGKLLAQQWLRLKLAGEMLSGDNKRNGVDSLRQRLQSGESLEIAGYRCAPALIGGLEQARLLPPPPGSRLAWLELVLGEEAGLLPASTRTLAPWQEAALDVEALALTGPAFWQSTEIETAPSLIDRSCAWLERS